MTRLSGRFLLVLVCVLAGTVFSLPAEACTCVQDFEVSRVLAHSPAVFVGTVAAVERSRPDPGSRRVVIYTKTTVTFSVSEVLKGSFEDEIEVENGWDGQCAASLEANTHYLVYAMEEDDVLRILSCSRIRLVSDAEEELKYLEGLKLGEESTLLHGTVFSYTLDEDGNPERHAPQPPLDLVVNGTRERFRVSTVGGGYQIAVPPGQYQIWAESDGLAVTTPRIISLNSGESRLLSLAPTW